MSFDPQKTAKAVIAPLSWESQNVLQREFLTKAAREGFRAGLAQASESAVHDSLNKLVEQWGRAMDAEYPDSVEGRIAKAVLTSCTIEVEAALRGELVDIPVERSFRMLFDAAEADKIFGAKK